MRHTPTSNVTLRGPFLGVDGRQCVPFGQHTRISGGIAFADRLIVGSP